MARRIKSTHLQGQQSCPYCTHRLKRVNVHQQRLSRVAGGGVLSLAVDHYRDGLFDIRTRVNVYVAYAICVPQHRDASCGLDAAHELIGPARDHEL